jgi:hypothetical protein
MRFYLTELPIVILFAIAYHYNGYSTNPTKLYPLLIFLGLAMIFILVYFFRAISVSFEEVRYHGIFSSKDHSDITEGKELILTLYRKRRMRVELYGNDGVSPDFDWIKNGENYEPIDIYLFRGKAIGGKRKLSSLLRYFGVDEVGIVSVLEENKFSGEYEYVSLVSAKKEDETEVRLKFKETV